MAQDRTIEDQINQKSSAEHRPIYFGVALWGKTFCQELMERCLPSLLASGNIPALPNLNNQNKFLFCTTSEDWEWLQSHPTFILLSKYTVTEQISLDLISDEAFQKLGLPAHDYKYHMVSKAHTTLITRMYDAKCVGSIIFPDTIYAKNALKSVYPYILQEDKKAVLVHFPRFATPELFKDLYACGYIKPPMPIEIENRELIKHALKHRNLETLVQNWDSLYAFHVITDVWWLISKNEGMLFHSLMWWPVFIDYAKLTSHNTECLKHSTIDASYLYNNFTKDDLHVITDSDKFLMISYGPHANFRLKNVGGNNRSANKAKIIHWRGMIKSLTWFIDPLKLELLKYPVFVHANDLTRKDYKIQKKSWRIMQKILSKPMKDKVFFEQLKNFTIMTLIKRKFSPSCKQLKAWLISLQQRR